MAKSMYDIIKKQNGEGFAKAIRNYDNGLFDIPGLDRIVKHAGRYAEPLLPYLSSLKKIRIEEHAVYEDPIAMLKRAGYDAYYANTLRKQNAIKKYFEKKEELCTFRDPYRYKEYYIINAVRTNADQIKRARIPERDDEYGTSVISIQILKSGGFISIKNRYNHTVLNPDNTFNSNPDNIIPGLSRALKEYFHVDFSSQEVELSSGYTVVKNQICKYNYEIENTYCGADFWIRNGEIHEIDKQKEIMLGDGLLLNMQTRTVTDVTRNDPNTPLLLDTRTRFVEYLNKYIADKTLQITKNPSGGHDIIANGQPILTSENGDLVGINLPNADAIALSHLRNLRGQLDFSGVKEIDLFALDLSQVTRMNLNPNARIVSMTNVSHIPPSNASIVDFGGVDDLSLNHISSTAMAHIRLNPNASNIEIMGISGWRMRDYLDFSNVKNLHLVIYEMPDIKGIKCNPNANKIHIFSHSVIHMRGNLDFSNVNILRIHDADMSGAESIKFNPNASEIIMMNNNARLIGNVDFSNVKSLQLKDFDASKLTNITFPTNDNLIVFADIRGLTLDTLDLENVNNIVLGDTDLSKISNIKFNKTGGAVSIGNGRTRLKGKFNFSGISQLNLGYANLENADVKFNKNANSILLVGVTGLHGTHDLSNVAQLDLQEADLTNADIKFNPAGQYIDIMSTKGLHGALNFQGVNTLRLEGADLSRVTEIKLPKSGMVDMSPAAIQMRVGKSKLEYRMAQMKEKIRNLIQNKGTQNEQQN